MYELKLMFEWGGGTIWCDSEKSREKFGVGPIEDSLPVSQVLINELSEMTKLHDKALNWEYPPAPGPWSKEEYEAFNSKAGKLLSNIEQELGSCFNIKYVQVGEFSS
jgi:hypothetical protein